MYPDFNGNEVKLSLELLDTGELNISGSRADLSKQERVFEKMAFQD